MDEPERLLRCNKCCRFLPTSAFSKNNRVGDRGYQYTCKECRKPIARAQNLKKYGLDEVSFERLWRKHGGCCAICGKRLFKGSPGGFAVDHNHTTGEVRGLLCQLCNQGLGCLQDSPYLLEQAIKYLHDNGYYGPKEAGGTKAAA